MMIPNKQYLGCCWCLRDGMLNVCFIVNCGECWSVISLFEGVGGDRHNLLFWSKFCELMCAKLNERIMCAFAFLFWMC